MDVLSFPSRYLSMFSRKMGEKGKEFSSFGNLCNLYPTSGTTIYW